MANSISSRWQLEAALQRVAPFTRPRRDLEQYTTPAEVAASVLLDVRSRWGGGVDGGDGGDDCCFAAGRSVLDLGCGPGALLIGCLALGAGYVCGVDLDAAALADCRRNLAQFYGQEEEEEGEGRPDDDDSSSTRCDLLQADICAIARSPDRHSWLDRLRGRFDTVITNPPFGTYSSSSAAAVSTNKKKNIKKKKSAAASASEASSSKGADVAFLELGIAVTNRLVVSLHKSSTMEHVMQRARSACLRRLQAGDGGDGDEANVATSPVEGRDYSVRQVAKLRYNLDWSYSHHRQESKDIDVSVLEVAILR